MKSGLISSGFCAWGFKFSKGELNSFLIISGASSALKLIKASAKFGIFFLFKLIRRNKFYFKN